MKPKRLLLLSALALLGAAPAPSPKGPLTDDFVDYMKKSLNIGDFGLRGERFHPYSTPRGWRIGYRQAVADKQWFKQGWPKVDAEAKLRADLVKALADAPAWAARQGGLPAFDTWSDDAKQIFVDRAYTEGLDAITPAFATACAKADWRTLFFKHLYLRGYDGAPDVAQNFTFAQRWIYSKKLIPDLQTGPEKQAAEDDEE